MAGQDAVNSARAFHEALPLTGVILTKTDGDARGGVALSVREVTGLPIKLVGTGEKVDALEPFVPTSFRVADSRHGRRRRPRRAGAEDRRPRGDGEARDGKVKQGQELEPRGLSASSCKQMVSMGGLEQLLDKLPGLKPEQLAAAKFDPKLFRRQIGIIDSMTPARAAPSGPDRRLAQAADRGGRGVAGPRRQPAAEAAQAARQDHEAAVQGRRHAAAARAAMRQGRRPAPMFRGRR